MKYLKILEKKFGKKSNKKTIIPCLDFQINIPSLIELRGNIDWDKIYLPIHLSQYFDNTIIIDTDHSIDPKSIPSDIYIANPLNIDQSFYLLNNILKINNLRIIIVINSILSFFPEHIDIKQLTSKFTNIKKLLKKSKSLLFVLNPYNEKRYNILNEISDMSIILNRGHQIKKNNQILGYFVKGKIIKNTFFLNLPEFSYNLIYNKGLQKLDS